MKMKSLILQAHLKRQPHAVEGSTRGVRGSFSTADGGRTAGGAQGRGSPGRQACGGREGGTRTTMRPTCAHRLGRPRVESA